MWTQEDEGGPDNAHAASLSECHCCLAEGRLLVNRLVGVALCILPLYCSWLLGLFCLLVTVLAGSGLLKVNCSDDISTVFLLSWSHEGCIWYSLSHIQSNQSISNTFFLHCLYKRIDCRKLYAWWLESQTPVKEELTRNILCCMNNEILNFLLQIVFPFTKSF